MSVQVSAKPTNGRPGILRALGRGVVVLLSALMVGAIGLACGSWLGWRAADPLLSDREAVGIANGIFPGLPVAVIERNDDIYSYDWAPDNSDPHVMIFGSDDYTAGSVTVLITNNAEVTSVLAEARHNLVSLGWEVDSDLDYECYSIGDHETR